MLFISTTDQFERDLKHISKQDKDLDELWDVVRILQRQEDVDLEAAYDDHPLHGEWAGVRDLHIEGDWLLLYRIEGNELHLVRTGTHADLFRSWN